MEIRPSARRHDITDDVILHAVRNVVRTHTLDEGVTMFVGPDPTGRLIEVGIIDGPVVIHAMVARPKFLR